MMRLTKAIYLSTLWIVLSMSCALLWMSFPELWPHATLPLGSWADRLLSSVDASVDPEDIAELQLLISFVICASVMAAGFFTVAMIRLTCRLTQTRP